MSNLLITTLGISWQIVPELFGFTNPDDLDLYQFHPRLSNIKKSRSKYSIEPVQEIWTITTQGSLMDEALDKLLDWHVKLHLPQKPVLRIWQITGTQNLGSETECKLMSEGIFRIVLRAVDYSGQEKVLLSLAGGRKTMSSDMQRAASVFGCKALLHVIDNGKSISELKALGPEDFTKPLPQHLEDALTPLVVSKGETDITQCGLAQDLMNKSLISSDLPLAQNRQALELNLDDSISLVDELEIKSKQAEFLFSNYTNEMLQGEVNSNFLALYLLPKAKIQNLKETKIGLQEKYMDQELAWLRKLPKAELHCHLGGIANTSELIEIASANEQQINKYWNYLEPWIKEIKTQIDSNHLNLIPDSIKSIRNKIPEVPEPICTAAFILCYQDCPEYLDNIIFGTYQNEKNFCQAGFKKYEALGDLQGSGLLQSKESIQAACRVLIRKAKAENIRYLELRCSPVNYTRGGLSAYEVIQIIDAELSKQEVFEYSILLIASRHGKMSTIHRHIELADELFARGKIKSLRGFDLAGSEKTGDIAQLRQAFMPMLEQCKHITIHAGETQDVGSIWQAVYHLSAERIGHGLTLKNNPDLMDKFRDRNIAIEMCPSSNFQIKGFSDNYYSCTQNLETYPLQQYLEQGLKVAICTDNPGISRTDFTNELLRAARLTPGGVSLWEICILLRNSFKSSFAPRNVRNRLLRNVESELIESLKMDFSETGASHART